LGLWLDDLRPALWYTSTHSRTSTGEQSVKGTTGDSLIALGGITWGNILAAYEPRADSSRLTPIPIRLVVVGGAVVYYPIINKTLGKH